MEFSRAVGDDEDPDPEQEVATPVKFFPPDEALLNKSIRDSEGLNTEPQIKDDKQPAVKDEPKRSVPVLNLTEEPAKSNLQTYFSARGIKHPVPRTKLTL